jgi:nucleotide-binding universal stress UspA family protein
MNSKILVPLDGSALSEKIVPQIKNLAEAMRADVVLYRVGTGSVSLYRAGVSAQEILQYGSDIKCDLIGMATFGRGKVTGVLKSVAEKVASHAAVPVLFLQVKDLQSSTGGRAAVDDRTAWIGP